MFRVCSSRVGSVFLVALFFIDSHALAVSQSDSGSLPKAPEAVEFDSYMLKNRNIDSKLASFFATSAKFPEGSHSVNLYVNGTARGRFSATFDKRGELIFTGNLLDAAQLKKPESEDAHSSGRDTDFMKVYPMTEVELKPGKSEVWLIVPTDALREIEADIGVFNQGGTAALLNYNLIGMNSEFKSGSSEFRNLDTVAGFNAGDWIVRSRQSYSIQDGDERVSHMYAYGQKNFMSLKSTLQGGQINLDNSLFSGIGITGVQLVPELALRKLEQSSGAEVEGVANSTARVEVRQSGALIYSTVVPAGPFRLTELPLLNSSGDLDVRVVEADGAVRSFTIPAASFSGGTQGAASGYSFALGKYRDDSDVKPNLLTTSGTWRLGRNTSTSAGLMIADGYESFGWASDHVLTPNLRFGVRQVFSSADELGEKGAMLSATLNARITNEFNLSLSATQQTEGYLSLGETTYDQDGTYISTSKNKGQYTAAASWANATLGSFRVSYSQSNQFDGHGTKRVIGSWSKKVKDVTVSLNMEKSLGETENDGYGDRAMLSVSFPLGASSVRTYANHDARGTRAGASFNQTVSDTFSYRVQGERDNASKETDLSVSANVLPHYTRATVGYSQAGDGSESFNGSLSGGIVAHADGVTLSPNEIKDTFSILSVGDMSGVKVSTPDGPVWTDAGGRAVVSKLQPYQPNRLQISAKSLPRNVDIVNGYKELKVGRGSVSRVDFDVVTTRRLLLDATLTDGSPLQKGSSVFAGDEYLTTVVDRGQIFIPNIAPGAHLTVELGEGQSCELDFALPEKVETEAYFESVNAVCRVAHG